MTMMVKLRKMFGRKTSINVVRLEGVIAAGRGFGAGGTLNDSGLADLLQKAFKKGRPKAVAISLNSPGGSPVQSSLIGARIRRLAEETEIPVFAFCEDVAASGGYWLACAADEIFVDESSVVGSIGVISASFGVHELMERHGIERRVHTAGEDKSMGDPFRPEKPKDVERLKALQSQIHDSFIAHVKSRRGDKLVDEDLFTGEVWIGFKAIEKGLVDGIGHLVPTMKQRFGEDVRFNVIGQKKPLMARLGLGAAVGDTMAGMADRTLWSRYGV